ncbi:MAG: cupredoxin domain-containing protein [Pseudomonadales bacterium]
MLVINLLGLTLIGFIVWWFWLYSSKEAELLSDDLRIRVENGVYQPARIKVPAGQKTTLHFFRVDESPCAEKLILPDLDISEDLPVNTSFAIDLPAMEPGEYAFHCQMQMYRGVVVAE